MIIVKHPTLGVCLCPAVRLAGRALRLVWSSECVDERRAGPAVVQEFADVAAATTFLSRGGVDYAASGCTAITVRDGDAKPGRTDVSACTALGSNGSTRLTSLVVER